MNINDLSILLAAVDIAIKRDAYSILEVGATKITIYFFYRINSDSNR